MDLTAQLAALLGNKKPENTTPSDKSELQANLVQPQSNTPAPAQQSQQDNSLSGQSPTVSQPQSQVPFPFAPQVQPQAPVMPVAEKPVIEQQPVEQNPSAVQPQVWPEALTPKSTVEQTKPAEAKEEPSSLPNPAAVFGKVRDPITEALTNEAAAPVFSKAPESELKTIPPVAPQVTVPEVQKTPAIQNSAVPAQVSNEPKAPVSAVADIPYKVDLNAPVKEIAKMSVTPMDAVPAAKDTPQSIPATTPVEVPKVETKVPTSVVTPPVLSPTAVADKEKSIAQAAATPIPVKQTTDEKPQPEKESEPVVASVKEAVVEQKEVKKDVPQEIPVQSKPVTPTVAEQVKAQLQNSAVKQADVPLLESPKNVSQKPSTPLDDSKAPHATATQGLIQNLEKTLAGRVLYFYVPSEDFLADDDVKQVYHHIAAMGRQEKLYVVLYGSDASAVAVYKLISILKSYSKLVSIVIPDNLTGMMSLAALAADEIVASPLSVIAYEYVEEENHNMNMMVAKSLLSTRLKDKAKVEDFMNRFSEHAQEGYLFTAEELTSLGTSLRPLNDKQFADVMKLLQLTEELTEDKDVITGSKKQTTLYGTFIESVGLRTQIIYNNEYTQSEDGWDVESIKRKVQTISDK
jgi:hypothetical protein